MIYKEAILFMENNKKISKLCASESKCGLRSCKCHPQAKKLEPTEDDIIHLVKNIRLCKINAF